jgi:hypothetical protein
MILKLIWLIILIVFKIIWKIIAIILTILLFILKIVVGVFVALYLAFRAFFPENGKTPFFNSKKIANIENIYRMEDLPYTLYIDLNLILGSLSEKKPPKGDYEIFKIHEIEEPPRLLYLQKRPHLDEFLEEVS